MSANRTPRLSFRVHSRVAELLDELTATGLYGRNRAGTAEILLSRQLREVFGIPRIAEEATPKDPAP